MSQLGAFCIYAIVYCYLEFKLRYLKNLKLFSISVKELFEPIVLRKKRQDNARWFYGRKLKIGKENLYLTEIDKFETKCAVLQIITIICVTYEQKDFFDKISSFHEIVPNFTYSQKSYFLKYNWNFEANCFFPINFMAGTCQESTFSFLPVVTP